MKKQQIPTLATTFATSLASATHDGKAAIALSGGLDSSVLLHLAHAWATEAGVQLFAFHIHHGISPNADSWLLHCEQQCAQLGVTFAARRIELKDAKKSGVEAAARKQRYAALGALCQEHGVNLLLTAHHLDDQAETVLLQLLRGSGTAGMSGMDGANAAPDLLQNPTLVMARPLLQASRAQMEAWAAQHSVAHIEDESNDDTRYARNALRHLVMPVLAEHFPNFQQRFARSARHAQAAQRLLDELAEQDLQAAQDGDSLRMPVLQSLSTDRCHNLLRHWFRQRGLAMPSTSWLHEMVVQLLEARHDAQLLVVHTECEVRRHRDRLYLAPKLPELAGTREDRFDDSPGQDFRWKGETQLAFPNYGGVLHFEEAGEGEEGIAADWLAAQWLTIEFRRGGEKLKPALNRSTRPLKYHYQALGIPAWERTRLPVVKAAIHLLFAAGIGMDCHHLTLDGAKRIKLRWAAE